MSLIECRKVTLGYEDRVVFRDMDFKVEAGDYLCIVGENGSGKSTLMKTLLGLNKCLAGEICFGEGFRQKEIGYLPQQTEIQRDFPASVSEVIKSGCINRMGWKRFYGRREQKMAEEKMAALGILDLKDRSYQELSGGQQQRVLLARAMCATSRLLLLDEPVTGLDPVGTADLYDTIRRLNREDHITIIMISHDMAGVMQDADHVLHLGDGDYFFGTTEEYLHSDYGRLFLNRTSDRNFDLTPDMVLAGKGGRP